MEKHTIETLAAMSQREFKAIREEMATKNVLQEALADQTRALVGRMDAGFGSLEQTIGGLAEDLRHWKHDILELQGRVARVEKHLGLDI